MHGAQITRYAVAAGLRHEPVCCGRLRRRAYRLRLGVSLDLDQYRLKGRFWLFAGCSFE